MPRRIRTIPGPSRLSGFLKQLTRAPRLVLSEDVTRLKLAYKFKGGDFAAKYFVKEELPRIRYANPALAIEVDKLDPTNPKQKAQKSAITLEFSNRPAQTISITHARSTGLLTALMALAGSPAWPEWVKQRTAKGEPIIPEPEAPAKPKAALATGPTAALSKKLPWRVKAPKAAAAKNAAVKGTGAPGGKQGSKGDIKELLGVADVGMPSLTA
ncbi:hypothetical protein FIBSPDRAFT_850628 [Athelia psychrophila]|uniref:Ribosomal protein/NADH dehydrogenase domain-containing protein n=1 Tax=Athelia psychrophila TaxID=1759441 RepID=A0A166T879_9AGAM|nr:hypothetical protein FIBSPDRAFT_850628 [Fibularhizoctonia sp. CBS 109695]